MKNKTAMVLQSESVCNTVDQAQKASWSERLIERETGEARQGGVAV